MSFLPHDNIFRIFPSNNCIFGTSFHEWKFHLNLVFNTFVSAHTLTNYWLFSSDFFTYRPYVWLTSKYFRLEVWWTLVQWLSYAGTLKIFSLATLYLILDVFREDPAIFSRRTFPVDTTFRARANHPKDIWKTVCKQTLLNTFWEKIFVAAFLHRSFKISGPPLCH